MLLTNFFIFQLKVIKDFYLVLISIIFIFSFFTGLSIKILSDFRFWYIFFLIIFNICSCIKNYERYSSLFKNNYENKKFIYQNKKYLILNDLLFGGYLYINYYYLNLLQSYLLSLVFFSLFVTFFTRRQVENVSDIELGNVGIVPAIEYHINRNGRRVLRYAEDSDEGL